MFLEKYLLLRSIVIKGGKSRHNINALSERLREIAGKRDSKILCTLSEYLIRKQIKAIGLP